MPEMEIEIRMRNKSSWQVADDEGENDDDDEDDGDIAGGSKRRWKLWETGAGFYGGQWVSLMENAFPVSLSMQQAALFSG